MPNIIDISYFVGEINIPNTDKAATRENLTHFIMKYQKRFLVLLLGEDVWREFMIGITPVPVEPATDPVTYEPIDAKWTELLNKLVDSDTKESPIANYVYYYFMRDGVTVTTDVGETASSAENSVIVSPIRKMVRAWNEMSDFVHGSKQWFHDYYATYNFNHDSYYFNLYCYNTYKGEFAKQNVLNL